MLILKYRLKIAVGFCSLLCSAMIREVLPRGFVIKTLALTVISYLGLAWKLLLYFGYHLMETISNYTSSSERLFMEEIQNGTLATILYNASSV